MIFCELDGWILYKWIGSKQPRIRRVSKKLLALHTYSPFYLLPYLLTYLTYVLICLKYLTYLSFVPCLPNLHYLSYVLSFILSK